MPASFPMLMNFLPRPGKLSHGLLPLPLILAILQYALASVVELKGLSPEDNLIQIKPREGEETFRTQDILKAIEDQGDEIALVIFSGLQYYTGEVCVISQMPASSAFHPTNCLSN